MPSIPDLSGLDPSTVILHLSNQTVVVVLQAATVEPPHMDPNSLAVQPYFEQVTYAYKLRYLGVSVKGSTIVWNNGIRGELLSKHASTNAINAVMECPQGP